MRDLSSKSWMYCSAVLAFPVAALFKGLFTWAVPLYVVAIVLIFADPLFKNLRRSIPSANRFIIVILLSGAIVGLIANIFPTTHTWLVACWCVFFIAYGWPIASNIDKKNGI
ncbi:MAG: hypothetical protein ABJJ44_06120 [Paraglaciecola sp.]|uniref:hypothetical protein n=1 Tax=Paraglaciecola sp. TaxID=1920173 RepID=UPI003299CDD6